MNHIGDIFHSVIEGALLAYVLYDSELNGASIRST